MNSFNTELRRDLAAALRVAAETTLTFVRRCADRARAVHSVPAPT